MHTTDLCWDDCEVLQEDRRDLSEVSYLHGRLDSQVYEHDLHHSFAVHVCDLDHNKSATTKQ